MYIIQLFSETMGCTHGLYNCNYLLYVCSVTMLVVPSVAHTVSCATCSLHHWSCCLSGALSVGHPSPMLSVTHAVSRATCQVRHRWATHRPHCWLHRLLPMLPVAHAISHHLPGAPSVAPLVARAVGHATCCAVSHATCCAVGHATCCTVGCPACCSTCRVRCRSCHSSPALLPVLPVALSVVPPVAPPVACAVCRTTHSLYSSSCPQSHCRLHRLLPTPHVALPVRCAVGQPPIAHAVGHATTCCPCHLAPPVGCAICRTTCSPHRLLCRLLHRLSRHLLPTPPVAPPITHSICHATHGPCCLTLAQNVVCTIGRAIRSLHSLLCRLLCRPLPVSHLAPPVRPPIACSCHMWGSVCRTW